MSSLCPTCHTAPCTLPGARTAVAIWGCHECDMIHVTEQIRIEGTDMLMRASRVATDDDLDGWYAYVRYR